MEEKKTVIKQKNYLKIPGLGIFGEESGLLALKQSKDGKFCVGKNGVKSICATRDKKVEFISFTEYSLAYVSSNLGYPAYYPVHHAEIVKPVKAVLMDLDGTTVKSEEFWIWIIERTIASLLDNSNFQLEESDMLYVSGHSVSEHLTYCIDKYCPNKSLEDARQHYFKHTHREMKLIMEGRGKKEAFIPAEGLKDFLFELKNMKMKIGLVTSGLYEKAWPEIFSAFNSLEIGNPKDFYDAIITSGYPLRKGDVGTLGEISSKPHPWLYAEISRVGLGIKFKDRNSVIGIDDSGAGICSIRLAGFPAIGISGGNIISSGTRALCNYYCSTFKEILEHIK